MRRIRRPLGPEEKALWSAIARTVRPLHAQIAAPAEIAEDRPSESVKLPTPPARIEPFAVASRTGPEPRTALITVGEPVLRMDARTFAKMRRGRLSPEARIDLHGMTVAEAHSALIAFLMRSQGAGHRLVLVITGKGKAGPGADDGPSRGGVLRHQVPHWLRLAPLGPRVLQVAEAHLSHGGAGALYVYLRRSA